MAITKDKKQQLLQEYTQALADTSGVVVIQQSWVTVEYITHIRKELHPTWAKLVVVRKRLFLRAVKEAGFQDVGLGDLEGSIAVLFNAEDEMAPLKVVNKYAKILAKDQSGSLKFLWAWFDKDWKDGEYISELAAIPSKDELLSKLVYLLNYPVQSFAATLNALVEKRADGENISVKEDKEETAVEENKKEAVVEEVKVVAVEDSPTKEAATEQ